MTAYGMKLVGLLSGRPSPFDGQWVVEYDPTRPGVAPGGRHMRTHIVCSLDAGDALRFETPVAAHELWCLPTGRPGPDGGPDRPLTAFSVLIEPLPEQVRE